MSQRMGGDSSDVVAAKRLVDVLKAAGFVFTRTAPGEDGPLLGQRVTGPWVDTVYVEGFSGDCVGWRQRRSSLVLPVSGVVDRRVSGGALAVLGEVSAWQRPS